MASAQIPAIGTRCGALLRAADPGHPARSPGATRDVRKMSLLLGHYEMFFATGAGASAAILGLLVVAVSVVNADDADAKTREGGLFWPEAHSLLWSTPSSSRSSR